MVQICSGLYTWAQTLQTTPLILRWQKLKPHSNSVTFTDTGKSFRWNSNLLSGSRGKTSITLNADTVRPVLQDGHSANEREKKWGKTSVEHYYVSLNLLISSSVTHPTNLCGYCCVWWWLYVSYPLILQPLKKGISLCEKNSSEWCMCHHWA